MKVATTLLLAAAGCAELDVEATQQANSSYGREVQVLTAADMTNRSAHRYRDNKWGLVTADTVKGWLDNWQANKPAHVKGRLFVMQMGQVFPLDDSRNYIKHDGVNTFTFDRTDACNDTGYRRTDGVSEIANAVFTGEYMDMAFGGYGIRPGIDMILLALGPGDIDLLPGATRSWYQLNYWGWDSRFVAVFNGAAGNLLPPDYFVANQSDFNFDGGSVRELRRDGTIFQATLGDMAALAKDPTGAVVLDARSPAEFAVPNGKSSKAEDLACGPTGTEQCLTAFEGHINNAVNLPFTDLLHTSDQTVDKNGDGVVNAADASYTFKSIPEMEALFAAAGYEDGKVIHAYCRTGARATVAAYAASTILGYPARMYDGSWIQYGKLANVRDHNGDYLLPADSPWRMDTAEHTVVSKIRNKSDGSTSSNLYVQHHAPGADPYAADTEAMIREDKAYKY